MITVNGSVEEYCNKCPFMDLVEIAQYIDGAKIYACANDELCARLYSFLKKEVEHGKDD